MKIHRLIGSAFFIVACLGLAFASTRASAQTTILTGWTNTFPNNGNTGLYAAPNWVYWYSLYQDTSAAKGTYNLQGTNDAGMDYTSDTNDSGSMYVYAPWSLALTNSSPNDQNVFYITFGSGPFDQSSQVQMITVTNISWYIHVDPSSTPDANGNFGTLSGGLIDIKYGRDDTEYLTIPGSATNGWALMSETNVAAFHAAAAAANSANPAAAMAFGVVFDQNSYGSSPLYPSNNLVYWIDNITLQTASVPPPPPPPPTVGVSPATQGLNLFTGSGTSLYNRESLQSAANYTWVGATGPVSYSFTITNYPVPAGDAVQCHIFLIPSPGTETAPDYTEPNLVFLDLESTTTGAQWNFRYKTNEANGNGFVYGAGTLASIGTNTGVGTWTVTFNNNTNVTMTIPGGASTNFSIPDSTGATSALFASGVNLYFGAQSGNAGGTRDYIVASEFKVTGTGSDFDDNFVTDNGVLNGLWTVNAQFPACVDLVGSGHPYWIQWTTPAPNYVLEVTPSLDNPSWTDVTNTAPFESGTNLTQLISTSDLPAGSNAFFGVIQHNLSALQVLLPGETAAPGTTTGKTGTPTPVSISGTAAGTITVTVNAADEKWNLIPGITDTVSLTTSDTAATIGPATSGPLVGGTEQFTVTFGTTGPQTVMATDTTDTALAAATSATVTVTP